MRLPESIVVDGAEARALGQGKRPGGLVERDGRNWLVHTISSHGQPGEVLAWRVRLVDALEWSEAERGRA